MAVKTSPITEDDTIKPLKEKAACVGFAYLCSLYTGFCRILKWTNVFGGQIDMNKYQQIKNVQQCNMK
ncbi:MAG: hypothetical protein J5908_03965 [Selenomonas sp.]|nr:hypothetical protein [Selenomonas sp.]